MNHHPLTEIISDHSFLKSVAKEYKTPLYVYSQKRLEENITKLSNSVSKNFSNYQIYYAVKANSNPHIISVLKNTLNTIGCDCSSPGELYIAEKARVEKTRCVYTGNYESLEDLQTAFNSGCEINLDDINSLQRIKNIAVPKYISFRLNPGKGHGKFKGIITGGKNSKFGIPKEKICEAYNLAKKLGVKKFGLQCHAGSATLDYKTFSDITRLILDSAKEIVYGMTSEEWKANYQK